ncbi:MAG: (Fe-S)-binding protein [Candidatus Freyarchaeum deiterrae]
MNNFLKIKNDCDLVNFIERCAKCSYCLEDKNSHLPICPSTEYFHLASHRPPGRLELARALIGLYDNIELDLNMDEIVKKFYSCMLCGACDYKCRELTGKSPLSVFMEVRKELFNNNIGPPAAHRILFENVLKHGNPQGMPREKRPERILPLISNSHYINRNAPLLYFVGCVSSYSDNLPSHAANMVRVLMKAETEFRILPDEPCCSHVLIKTGQENLILDYMKEAFDKVNSTGVKQVLFSCPACYRAFKYEYPKLLGVEPNFECITSSEFIYNLLNEGKLQPNGKGNSEEEVVVTYHDPCHLGRQSGIYDPPRKILESIKGLKLVEMPRNRENSWCCGVGGGVKTAFPEFSQKTSEERINEAKSVGATILVTACPACESGFKDALKAHKDDNNLKVLNVVDIIANHLGI